MIVPHSCDIKGTYQIQWLTACHSKYGAGCAKESEGKQVGPELVEITEEHLDPFCDKESVKMPDPKPELIGYQNKALTTASNEFTYGSLAFFKVSFEYSEKLSSVKVDDIWMVVRVSEKPDANR